MDSISLPTTRKDHFEKVSGKALYTADLPNVDVLHTHIIRAEKANARIVSVVYPPLPTGYFVADGHDLPCNEADLHATDAPVFAVDHCNYIGEAIAILAGPDLHTLARLALATQITYADEKTAIISLDEYNEIFYDYTLQKGDCDHAFAFADFIIDEMYYTGRQEQAYLETQSLEARNEDDVLTIIGSMQCPYYIVNALQHAFHLPTQQIRVIQATTGGGFGGKEEYPSLLACQLATIAIKSGKPCRLTFDRREDMSVTTKRHPARIHYRAAMQNNLVSALDVDILLDGGAYRGLSSVVLQRSMFCASGAYNIENLSVRGRVAKTNTPINGAFRGFGAPQTFYAIETLMSHIAKKLHVDAMAFKKAHFVKQHDKTATSGVYHEQIPLDAMLSQAMDMSGYRAKMKHFAKETGTIRHGIGLSCVFHGCGFTGNGERDVIKATLRLEKTIDGTVTIHAAGTEMGQGLRTTLCKIAAKALGLPLDSIHYALPDTLHVPNSGPTVASRSIMIVGKLVQRAAEQLKAEWIDGQAQSITVSYVDPPHRLSFDSETFTGDAYPAYSWAVNVVEVAMDMRTYKPEVTGVWAVFDCGTPIDDQVLRGQAEGGIVQGLGYAAMENMEVRQDGAILQNSFTDYVIPTALDIPPMQVAFHNDPYTEGPFGARGAGELTLVGVAPAYVAAVENAMDIQSHKIPLLPEDLLLMRKEEA